VRNEEVRHRFEEERYILHAVNERRLTESATCFVEDVLLNTLLKERCKKRRRRGKDVSSYWMIFKTRENTGN
jgi:hypothetical protein